MESLIREFTIESLEIGMSWASKRSQVQGHIDQLATVDLNKESIDGLKKIRYDYENINQGLTRFLGSSASQYNLSDKLEETGRIQTQIQHLEEENEKMKTDVDTALARDELLRSKDRSGNGHTLYVLDRPVRRGMVPYLWVLSILFVGIGVLLFYWLTPMILLPSVQTNAYGSTSGSILTMLIDVFTNRLTWMALFGAACIVILFLSLKIAGVFGK
jgi:hypothetical protein